MKRALALTAFIVSLMLIVSGGWAAGPGGVPGARHFAPAVAPGHPMTPMVNPGHGPNPFIRRGAFFRPWWWYDYGYNDMYATYDYAYRPYAYCPIGYKGYVGFPGPGGRWVLFNGRRAYATESHVFIPQEWWDHAKWYSVVVVKPQGPSKEPPKVAGPGSGH